MTEQNKSLIVSKDELDVIKTICQFAADSKYFDKLGGLAGVMCIALYAHEIGVTPLTALMGGMRNIQGQITMAPELMLSLIRSKGHKVKVIKLDDTICILEGERADTKETMQASFSLDDAKRAQLIRAGSGWEKYPSDMMFARAISRLKRRLFTDVATKAYVEGEIEEAEFEEVKPKKGSKTEPATKIAHIPDMSLEEFVGALAVKLGDKAPHLRVEEYLAHLMKKTDGKFKQKDIMAQALDQPERFATSYRDWYAAQMEVETIKSDS